VYAKYITGRAKKEETSQIIDIYYAYLIDINNK